MPSLPAASRIRFARGRRFLFAGSLALSTFLQMSATSQADTIAVFYALDADLAALKEGDVAGARTASIGSVTVQGFSVGAHKVWAVKMGAGNVETAVNSTALLAKFPSDLALSIGPAGALSPGVEIGHWYEIRKVTGYQRGTFDATGWQVAKGATTVLPGNPGVAKAADGWKIERGIPLASGEAFVAREAENSRIAGITGAVAIDMNSFGLVRACEDLNTPLVLWKVISDRADSRAGEDFRKFLAGYDGEGGRQIRQLLLKLPSAPNSPAAYEHLRKLMER